MFKDCNFWKQKNFLGAVYKEGGWSPRERKMKKQVFISLN